MFLPVLYFLVMAALDCCHAVHYDARLHVVQAHTCWFALVNKWHVFPLHSLTMCSSWHVMTPEDKPSTEHLEQSTVFNISQTLVVGKGPTS